jgi:GDP-mannose 6-dehydrogenase
MLSHGESPVVEPGVSALIREMVDTGRLVATADGRQAVLNSGISLVCVGTPSNLNGSINLCYIQRVCKEIGEAIREKDDRHIVVIRSTVLPGTVEDVVIPAIEEASRKRQSHGFDICVNPEFLREGSSLEDFYAPPFTVIGAADKRAAAKVAELYSGVDAPLFVTGFRTAEMVKYACNAFHGLKVAFANEIGNICKALGIDSHDVMQIFCRDTKLNLGAYYLRPGFAFGGSCLPKDIRAVTYQARRLDVETPVLTATLDSNRKQVERAVQMVLQTRNRRIGVLGLSFKAGTDDLRESPMVALVEALIGKGLEVNIYDPEVLAAQLLGANRAYIEREIPHIWSLMRNDISEVLCVSDTVVIGNRSPVFRSIDGRLGPGQMLIDLVRLFDKTPAAGYYDGICW